MTIPTVPGPLLVQSEDIAASITDVARHQPTLAAETVTRPGVHILVISDRHRVHASFAEERTGNAREGTFTLAGDRIPAGVVAGPRAYVCPEPASPGS